MSHYKISEDVEMFLNIFDTSYLDVNMMRISINRVHNQTSAIFHIYPFAAFSKKNVINEKISDKWIIAFSWIICDLLKSFCSECC